MPATTSSEQLKFRIYEMCAQLEVEPVDLMQALATITGEVAHKLDGEGPGPMPFAARMESFNHAAKVAYAEIRVGIKVPIVSTRLG